MATATRNRRAAASALVSDETVETAVTAIATVATVAPEGASEAQTRDVCADLEEQTFRGVFSALTLGVTARFAAAATDDEIAKSHHIRAAIAAYAVWDNDADAIAAAKADNAGWEPRFLGLVLTNPPLHLGAALRAFGQNINKNGVRPWTEKEREAALAKGKTEQAAGEGKFVRSALQHQWWDNARKAWESLTKTDAEKAADKAKRSAKATEAAAKKKAAEEEAAKNTAANMMRGNGEFSVGKTQNETFRIMLNWAQQGRAAHRAAIASRTGLDTELGQAIEAIAKLFDDKSELYCD